jgi:hypothetical protein
MRRTPHTPQGVPDRIVHLVAGNTRRPRVVAAAPGLKTIGSIAKFVYQDRQPLPLQWHHRLLAEMRVR